MTDDEASSAIEVLGEWVDAIGAIITRSPQRVMIVGSADVGKSSLALMLLHALARAGKQCLLFNADPGQKMVGPPGTVSLGELAASGPPRLRSMRFIGTTSAAAVAPLLLATEQNSVIGSVVDAHVQVSE